jgi:Mg2+/citrate symporter
MEITIIIAGAVVILAIALFIGLNVRRRLKLMAKYNDQHAVDMIMSKRIWEGMTEAQLIEAWGKPAEIDERVLKTKTAHVYKYNRSGKASFRDKVKLDDGVVIGWEQKGREG